VNLLRLPLPDITPPEPVFMITVTHPSARVRRAVVHALQFLLWIVPAGVLDSALLAAGRHSLWPALAATYVLIVVAMVTVGVREDDGEGES
jgi:membrane protein YdbS with pleckstrin-like domain